MKTKQLQFDNGVAEFRYEQNYVLCVLRPNPHPNINDFDMTIPLYAEVKQWLREQNHRRYSTLRYVDGETGFIIYSTKEE